jgi:hypothetical protein
MALPFGFLAFPVLPREQKVTLFEKLLRSLTLRHYAYVRYVEVLSRK